LLMAPAAQRAFLAGQPVANLPLDVDAVTQLRHLGIRTLGQYTRLPTTGVLARFGQAGRTAQRWAQGLDDRPVVPPWECPEVSARIEFESPLADRERLLAALARRADQLLLPLRDRLQAIARIFLHVTCADGRTFPVTHTFPLPTAAVEPVRWRWRASWRGRRGTGKG
jgi:protein ImuB